MITWQAPEFRYFEKTASWFTGTIIIAIILGILAILQGNFLFLIFIIIAEALVLHWGKRIPNQHQYILTNEGIEENGRHLYPYSHYESFAFVHDNRLAELILKPKRKLSTYARILLPVSRTEEIAKALSAYLPVFEYEETFIEHLTNRMRL